MTTPTDAELVVLLRERLAAVEHGIHTFLDVLGRTGSERQDAWNALLKARQELEWDTIGARYATETFLGVYQQTMPERLQASTALNTVLKQTFRESVLFSADLQDEDRAVWLTTAYEHDQQTSEEGATE